ncbi:MAG: hypothetical protein RL708_1147 [Bacteroidota bacterium]|jgi:UDP-N-acetylmuramate: L-alanyl-gamma-D-glutamyl-meso-diaminopimelate ligase
MRYHIIACGGSIMHQLTIQLKLKGNIVTGSDDEIFEPALSNLKKHDLLPTEMGWNADRITNDIDVVIVGMHAHADNPEWTKAKELGLKIYSYPEFIYEHSKNKQRICIAGSHGKTTITGMVMHVLKENKIDFDFLVGAKLEGFDYSVQLTDAPIMVIEADEYPDSQQTKIPKFLFYKPHVACISGIAWDHINIFPTFENYVLQFKKFIETIEPNGYLFYNEDDKNLVELIADAKKINVAGYTAHQVLKNEDSFELVTENKNYAVQIFGEHNFYNINAAYNICKTIGLSDEQFYTAIQTFKGAAKRLQLIYKGDKNIFYFDFAHAPSKVKATVKAMQELSPNRKLIACLELHTYSSLNKDFLKEFNGCFEGVDFPIVFYSEHSFEMKRLPPFSPRDIIMAFGNGELKTFNQPIQMLTFLKRIIQPDTNLLMMTSGNFGGLKMEDVSKMLFR